MTITNMYGYDNHPNVRYVIAITGASGCMYGIRLLQELKGERILVMSKMAKEIIPQETGYSIEDVEKIVNKYLEG